ncbi:PQQ-binding-like beta-propeller repeat protein [Amycolatopsis roodepoortensis]|uniref:Outer membrane protein assembly factor BamB n=1 Tax=Amycolatopsis roodepoortensis TaxID=700274 RepID=A0ABR9LF04_9PSEU|nr:PQQ-binding-like beta-propeller repeat protein [Amycolatopsis roodepoortensis]MBE1578877.1 outer membrane protein assembly factor BamB [Amycolatopsis roodepoortensis]
MRRFLVFVACLGAALTASGCGTDDPAPAPVPSGSAAAGQPPTSATPEAKTADPPRSFDKSAPVALPPGALRSNVAGHVTSLFMTLRDRTGYIVTPTALNVVDVLTGQQKWTVPFERTPGDPYNQSGPFVNTTGPRPPAVGDKLVVAAVPVVIPEKGTTPGYVALSVIAADREKGTKVWQSETKVSDDQYADASNAVTEVVAVTDKAVIARYGRSDDHVTVALDPASGKTLWERKDYEAGSVHGDVVVGADFNVAENSSMVQATALDLATGGQKWTGAARSSAVVLVRADPALVVLTRTDYGSGDSSLLFLDPATGAEKRKVDGEDQFGPSSYGTCRHDERSVLVCDAGGVLTGYDAATAAPLWTLPDKAANRVAPSVTLAWHGAVYGKTGGGQPIVLDARTGKDLATDDVGLVPALVSEYAGIAAGENGESLAYPVKS